VTTQQIAHFRTDPTATSHFDRIAKTSVANAVRFVIQAGFSVLPADVDTPHLIALAKADKSMRVSYGLQYAIELSNERSALQLIEGQANVRRASTAAASKRDAEARTEWTRNRVAELEAEHFANLKAGWQAQAEQEARDRFDAAPVAVPDTAPVPHKSRKQAA
jgi:hypothetical protein